MTIRLQIPRFETVNEKEATIQLGFDLATNAINRIQSDFEEAIAGIPQVNLTRINNYLVSILSVLNFGAKGDGVTDDTAAINAAVAAISTAGGGVLLFPLGTYRANNIDIPSNTFVFLHPLTIISYNGTTASNGTEYLFRLNGVTNVGMTGGKCLGTVANNSEGRHLIRMVSSSRVNINNMLLDTTDGDGIYMRATSGFANAPCEDIWIENVVSQGMKRNSYSVTSARNITFKDCIGRNNIGLASGSGGHGWDIEPNDDDDWIQNVRLLNCKAADNFGHGGLIYLIQTTMGTNATRELSVFMDGFYSARNKNGLRLARVLTDNGKFMLRNIVVEENDCYGLIVDSKSLRSRLEIKGLRLVNNWQETTAANWSNPAYVDGTTNTDAQTDMILHTDPRAEYESLNSGTGLQGGGMLIEDVVVEQSKDIPWLNVKNYTVADGYAAGSSYVVPQRDITIRNVRVKNAGGKSWNLGFVKGGLRQIHIDDAQIWNASLLRYLPFAEAHTADDTLTLDEQETVHTNSGASATVTFTLPALPSSSTAGKIYRFRFRVDAAQLVRIVADSSADRIHVLTPGTPSGTSLISCCTPGGYIELESSDPSLSTIVWTAKSISGFWWHREYRGLSDADYSVTRLDNGILLSDSSHSTDRTITLFQAADEDRGVKIIVANLNHSRRTIIAPHSSQQIDVLTTAVNKRIQMGGNGAFIILEYVGNNIWMPINISGAWYDIDGLGSAMLIQGVRSFNDNIAIATAGKGIAIKEGSNARMGVATLVAGAAVVSTTAVTANSRIFLTRQSLGGTLGTSVDVTARTAGTSFTITAQGSILDTSVVAWEIKEPA